MFYFLSPNRTQEERFMQSTHVSALEAKHAVLDRRISDELHRPQPNEILLGELKRRKLRVKEEIGLR